MATIKLSEEELGQYYFWPQDLYFCELGLNDQELSDKYENILLRTIIQTSDIKPEHHNFLKWIFARMLNLESNKIKFQAGRYSDVVTAFSSLNNMKSSQIKSVKITGFTSENELKTIFLPILDIKLSVEIMQRIEVYLQSFQFPNEINNKRGRPLGPTLPGREELLSNLAYNLRVIISPSENSAKLLLFKFGVLLNYWPEERPDGKYYNNDEYFKAKMVNKYFVKLHDLKKIALINPPTLPDIPFQTSQPIPD